MHISFSVSNSTIGTQISVMRSGDHLTVWSSVANNQSSVRNDSVFSNAQIPSTCGDRLFRCNAELLKDTHSSRTVLVISLPYGVALSLYNEINSANFTFVDQYVAVPHEHKINCSFTSFTTTTDNRLIVSCLKFTPEILYEVSMWLFEVHVNFIAINESYLRLLNRDGPYRSYSTGISPLFFYDQDNDHEPFIIWFDDGVLFNAFLNTPHFVLEKTEVDTAGGVCSGNKVTDVRQSLDRRQLLVYCSQNIAVEVDVMRRGIGVLKTRSKTRFYCKSQWEEPYLEERNNTLVLVSHERNDSIIILHPLNLSERYVGDCVMIENTVWFIGSSRDGTIVLTSVLENRTTVLTTDATVNHKLIDRQVLLFSDSNSSTVINLECPSFRFTVDQTFLLSVFEPNQNFSCPEDNKIEPTTPLSITSEPTSDEGSSTSFSTEEYTSEAPSSSTLSQGSEIIAIGISVVGVITSVAVILLCLICCCILLHRYWSQKRYACYCIVLACT